jgi:hypothetical protein
LNAETFAGEDGPVIFLSQPAEGYNDPDKICLHPWQLRAVCERFGIFETSDPQAQKTIAALTRRLLVLRERIDHMACWLANHSDSKHADLSYEQTYATATADIAGEFCTELEGVQPSTEPPKQAPEHVKPLAAKDPRQMAIEA